MEAVPGMDTLLNQEIRAADIQLDIRSTPDRTPIQMRCDLGIMRLTHRCDLLRLKDTPCDCQIHLQNRCRLLFQ